MRYPCIVVTQAILINDEGDDGFCRASIKQTTTILKPLSYFILDHSGRRGMVGKPFFMPPPPISVTQAAPTNDEDDDGLCRVSIKQTTTIIKPLSYFIPDHSGRRGMLGNPFLFPHISDKCPFPPVSISVR
ncbi:hypothetical protein CEXT_377051 [Caerostris extrusa]|uniref:Uncharacterized protein n=1 Tax=Caerostris extrusa TaxID=172846 RepID=A0AAV4W3V3_CAEEX|nr:hypothetical protein CEXT_377051 [Caerostris extrusa]